MKSVTFATGNDQKFLTASHVCERFGIQVLQEDAEVVEIQSEDPAEVASAKARAAYEILKKPVVITDDSWSYAGLNGFPGVYMHSMNTWFTPEDFLRLTQPLKDRRATFTQHLVYDDGEQQKVFRVDVQGTILSEIRGKSKFPSHTIVSLEGDDGLSIAEVFERPGDKSERGSAQAWHQFCEWFSQS